MTVVIDRNTMDMVHTYITLVHRLPMWLYTIPILQGRCRNNNVTVQVVQHNVLFNKSHG